MASNRQQETAQKVEGLQASDSRLFQMKEHCDQSFLVMNQLRKEGQLCDISFRVGSESLSAHRIVVASVSPYLRAMFTCGMRESSQEEIELRDIEPRAMAALIDYAYTGEVMVTVENVQDLLPAAGILQLRELKAACCSFLSDHMDTTNCLGIKQFADLHSCPELLKKANRFIIRKFVDVVKHDEFLQLPQLVLTELLENDHLHVESEEQVFHAFIRWVNHDLIGRSTNAYQLFEAVRFHLLPKGFWENIFKTEVLFQQNGECKAFMKGYLTGMNPEKYVVKPRSPIEAIYTVGGRNSQRCLPSGERYVVEDNRWEELPPMKQVRTAVAVGALDGKLFAVGGECETKFAHEGTLYLPSVEYYDPIHNEWTNIRDMKHPRSFTAVAILKNKLYAIGGETTAHTYKSVECYNSQNGAWSSVPDMHIARSGAGACAVNGKLYVVGGQDRAIHHSTMECYDPNENCWHLCANMRHPRSGVAVVVHDKYIYAIGGRDRHRQAYYDIVERFSPELNTWENFNRLTHPRAWPSACVFRGHIYVTGGYDGQFRLKTVERFEPDEKKWVGLADMNEFRAGCGSAVL